MRLIVLDWFDLLNHLAIFYTYRIKINFDKFNIATKKKCYISNINIK